jgi:Xaa-Pro aminopeptidase
VNDTATPEETLDQDELAARAATRTQRPTSKAFLDFVTSGWAPRMDPQPRQADVAPYAAKRRARVAELFPGERLVFPAGTLRIRSNDTTYRFRPHSAFAYLTGLGTDEEPNAVLVLHPDGDTHKAVLYFRPDAGRDTEEFFADSTYGEFWVGPRPTLTDLAVRLDLHTAHIDELRDALSKDTHTHADAVRLRVISGVDTAVDALVDEILAESGTARDPAADAQLLEAIAELRLVKDEWEIGQMQVAADATIGGFAAIVRALPDAVHHARGERVIEAAFDAHARKEGNAVGYDTIAAAGNNATILHWTRNDGPVRPGELVLIDAGVEIDSLYTADITRTLPVDGVFTDIQRKIYNAVLDAADAAFAVVRPGTPFRAMHDAAMEVLAHRLAEWGLLPVTAQEALAESGGQHRRWMVHGTGHHLGLDVHDCAQARSELYLDGVLEPGMIFTIEPGLYFKADDELVPAEYRGIGIRLEDNVLVTADGGKHLTGALPRRPEDVEAWMATLLA